MTIYMPWGAAIANPAALQTRISGGVHCLIFAKNML